MIASDHGTEFTCNTMLAWCKAAAIDCCHRSKKLRDPS
jgi:hypothetical protein